MEKELKIFFFNTTPAYKKNSQNIQNFQRNND